MEREFDAELRGHLGRTRSKRARRERFGVPHTPTPHAPRAAGTLALLSTAHREPINRGGPSLAPPRGRAGTTPCRWQHH